MLLSELLRDVEYKGTVADGAVTSVTADSRQVREGCVFVCICGQRFDGHFKAQEALDKGALCVVAERDDCSPADRTLLVSNSRSAYARMCSNFYGRPSEQLKLVGVTGTNGKTTITCLIKGMLRQCGKRVGLIGTIHNEIDDMTLPAKYTTPDPGELHLLLRRMVDAGCDYAVMEVSSHALDQHRLDGCRFETAVFTNLTQDHLDYHETMENYFAAKRKLFDMCGSAVINLDDRCGEQLAEELSCPVLTYSVSKNTADYSAHNIKYDRTGSSFAMVGNAEIGRVKFCMPGEFSVSNALAAGTAVLTLGLDFEGMIDGLNRSGGVTGRSEILDTGTDFTVLRDYAHSPDSLEKILTTVREFATGRVVVLFGCAGNRDRTKRPKMARIASQNADFVILTSDNPRDEDPEQIIQDTIPGLLSKTPHKVITDRYQAIKWALEHAWRDDILVLAGKGHEDYQVLDFGTICFDESKIVSELIAAMKENGWDGSGREPKSNLPKI